MNKLLIIDRKILCKNRLFVSANILFALVLLSFLFGCSPNIVSTNLVTETVPESNSIIAEQDVIRIANGYWPPYNGEKLENGGCDTNIVKETFQIAGYDVDFGYFPWARSMSLSASGDWDGTLTWEDVPEYRETHWISKQPTSIQEWVFFYRSDEPLIWQSMNDIKNKTIGITTGYVYSEAFTDLVNNPEYKFLESTSDEINFRMLASGRIDVFPMEKKVGTYILEEELSDIESGTIVYNEHPIAEFRSHLLLSKAIPKNETIIKDFDAAFLQLEESGRYIELLEQCN